MKPLLEEISLGISHRCCSGVPNHGAPRDESWDVPLLPDCCGTAWGKGVIADIWVWDLAYCLFDVRNVGPFWLMRCNGCRSPCTGGGCLDDVNALNYVVNTFKQKLLMTTLAAGLFFQGSYLRPSGLKCGPVFQRDPQKVPQQTSEVCK